MIPSAIAQIFNPMAEFAMSTGTQLGEINLEKDTQSEGIEANISKLSLSNLSTYQSFYIFKSLYFISSKR